MTSSPLVALTVSADATKYRERLRRPAATNQDGVVTLIGRAASVPRGVLEATINDDLNQGSVFAVEGSGGDAPLRSLSTGSPDPQRSTATNIGPTRRSRLDERVDRHRRARIRDARGRLSELTEPTWLFQDFHVSP